MKSFLRIYILTDIPHIKIKYEFSMSFGYIFNEIRIDLFFKLTSTFESPHGCQENGHLLFLRRSIFHPQLLQKHRRRIL